MRQVDELVDAEAVDEVVHDDGRVDVLGLADDGRRARVVEEEVVHQAGPPGRDAVRAAEADVADEGVPAAVEVAGVEVASEAVLLESS